MLIESSSVSQDTFMKSLTSYTEMLVNRGKHIISVYDTLTNSYDELAKYLKDSANVLRCSADALDMKFDFQRFVEIKRIFRYNITCPEFEEIDYDFDNNHVVIEDKNEFPVGLGEVVENFICGGENEISCVKGKRVLLMEFPDDDEWCCIMHPFTHVMGYVPSYCIKVVQGQLGVCIREPKQGEFKGVVVGLGDFVSIIENNPKDKMYKIETTHGVNGLIFKGTIAIVYG